MSRTPKLAAVAVLAAFSSLALQVQAQETVELDEVKVTAGRVEQELMDVNMSVSVITQEEITKNTRAPLAICWRIFPAFKSIMTVAKE